MIFMLLGTETEYYDIGLCYVGVYFHVIHKICFFFVLIATLFVMILSLYLYFLLLPSLLLWVLFVRYCFRCLLQWWWCVCIQCFFHVAFIFILSTFCVDEDYSLSLVLFFFLSFLFFFVFHSLSWSDSLHISGHSKLGIGISSSSVGK